MRAETVTVCIVGDSNVVGVPSDEGSFRLELGELLTDDGYDIEFVGQFNDVGGDHEGYNGKDYAWYVGTQISRIMTDYRPRIVVLWLGTNDQTQGSPTSYDANAINDAEDVLDAIFAAEPKTWVVVCTPPPWAPGYLTEADDWIERFGRELEALVNTKAAAGKRVRICHSWKVMDPGNGTNADLVDGVHLSAAGRTKAAQVIHDAIADIFESVGDGSTFMRGKLGMALIDEEGDKRPNVAVTVYEDDGVTLLAQTMYSSESGGAILSNPLTTDSMGNILAFVNTPQSVILSAGGATISADFHGASEDTPSAILTATGDLLYGTAANTAGRLAMGSEGYQLFAGPTTPQYDRSSRRSQADNGMLRFWGRGTSFSADGVGPERFRISKGSGGTPAFTVSQITATPGDVPPEPEYGVRFNQTAVATSSPPTLGQRTENVRRDAGCDVTVSFWARCNSGTVQITPRFIQNFGSGGSPSSAVNTDAAVITLTTTLQRFKVTFSVPSITGKTVGTTRRTSYTEIQLMGPLNTTFQYDLYCWQRERGSVATDFEWIDEDEDRARCDWMFWKIGGTTNEKLVDGGVVTGGNTATYTKYFPEMRIAPTVGIASASAYSVGGTALVACTALIDATKTTRSCVINATVAAGLTTGQSCYLYDNGGSGVLTFDAEL